MNKINKILADGIENCVEGDVLSLNDSTQAYLKGLKVMGKTKQSKTNGYQLFDVKSMNFSTQKGVAVNKLDNGSIRLTKTKLGGHLYASGVILNLAEFVGKTLYISAYAKASTEVTEGKNNITISYGNSTTGTTKSMKDASCVPSRTSTKLSITITPTTNDLENYDTIRLVLYENAVAEAVGSVGDYVDYSDIMISTKDVAYEPYTGGIPAPNVNYPQPLNSVGDDGSVDVDVHGYQLFDASAIDGQAANGVTVTNNGDGSFTVTGVATRGFSIVKNYNRKEALKLLRAGQISLSNNGVYGYPYAYMSLFSTNGKYFELNTMSATYKTSTITQEMLDDESLTMRIGIYNKENDTTVTYLKPMLYQDGDGTWEPFKPIQTLTIPTPNGLPAVPVSSDGNYTDASGQQWVCDEKDYNRGAYVERVYKYVNTGESPNVSSAWYKEGIVYFAIGTAKTLMKHTAISSHFKRTETWSHMSTIPYMLYVADSALIYLSIKAEDAGVSGTENLSQMVALIKAWFTKTFSTDNPLVVYSATSEPSETPLSEEEIAAYKELHAYYPYTSIHNSDNAHMAVKYVADTKNYVDNKIASEVAKLSAAIITE